MKKMTLIVIEMLLVTGASGAYGYFYINQSEDSDEVEVQQEQVQVDQDIVLKMNLLIALNMMGLVFCPWLIQDQILMVVSFLSLI